MAKSKSSTRIQQVLYAFKEPFVRCFTIITGSLALSCLLYLKGHLSFFATALFIAAAFSTASRISVGGRIPADISGAIDLSGKTVIVTGGNVGIGHASAVQLLKWRARVIIACRDPKRGLRALSEIKAAAGLPLDSDVIRLFQLDLADLTSVKSFAEKVNKENVQISVLLNNAGVMLCPFSTTSQGWEMQFGTNVLGHHLLTRLLLDNLKRNDGRVVNVSSLAHWYLALAQRRPPVVSVDEVRRWTKENYSTSMAYGTSKAANILCTFHMDKELESEALEMGKETEHRPGRVTMYSCHPGAVVTNLSRHMGLTGTLMALGKGITSKAPHDGAQTQLMLSAYPKELLKSGGYYMDCAQTSPIPEVDDMELAESVCKDCDEAIKPYM